MTSITINLTSSIYVKVRNYSSGKQVLTFRSKKHSNEFVVIYEPDNQIICNFSSMCKLYAEIKEQWRESRNASKFRDLVNFIKRCNSTALLNCTRLNLTNLNNVYSNNQLNELNELIISKQRELENEAH